MSGFDEDPKFEIISMPEDTEPGQGSTGEMYETEESLDEQDGSDRMAK
jgi:hypothetical protein